MDKGYLHDLQGFNEYIMYNNTNNYGWLFCNWN